MIAIMNYCNWRPIEVSKADRKLRKTVARVGLAGPNSESETKAWRKTSSAEFWVRLLPRFNKVITPLQSWRVLLRPVEVEVVCPHVRQMILDALLQPSAAEIKQRTASAYCYDTIRHDTTRHDRTRQDTTRHHLTWHGVTRHCIAFICRSSPCEQHSAYITLHQIACTRSVYGSILRGRVWVRWHRWTSAHRTASSAPCATTCNDEGRPWFGQPGMASKLLTTHGIHGMCCK